MASSNFTIEGRAFAAGFKDVQRTWLWELVIEVPTLAGIDGYDSERFLVHCRNATIPGRSQGIITSNFGGMVQYFMGKPTFEGTFAVTVEETEDMYIKKFLEQWQEAIFGTSDKTVNQGYSNVASIPTGQKKGLVAKTCELQLFKVDGTEADKKFRFVNAIVQSVGSVAVAYSDESAVQYAVTFQYDYYDLIDK